jgi:hypothetical protein
VSDYQLSDPQWQSFETELAAHVPQVSIQERDQILYACAFAAGQSKERQSVRTWKVMAAVLSLLLTVSLIPHRQAPPSIVRETRNAPVYPETTSSQAPSMELVPESQRLLLIDLDAWKVHSPENRLLSEQLSEFAQFDPHLRSLTVSSMNRTVFGP